MTKDIIKVKDLNLYYGQKHALKNINLDIKENQVTALIGPSGCGKSTFLRTINRMNDLIDTCRISGTILYDGNDIYAKGVDVNDLRLKIGMVFQNPIHLINQFMKTLFMVLNVMELKIKRN